MPRIFISYRRKDSEYVAAILYEALVPRYGQDSIFVDVDSIPMGVDFRQHLSNAVGSCDLLLAIMGPNWAGPHGQDSRLLNPEDLVRIEVETALTRAIPVIPVLVSDASFPVDSLLPDSLKELRYRNATTLRGGKDFQPDLKRLLKGIEDHFAAPVVYVPPRQKPEPDGDDSTLESGRPGKGASEPSKSDSLHASGSEKAASGLEPKTAGDPSPRAASKGAPTVKPSASHGSPQAGDRVAQARERYRQASTQSVPPKRQSASPLPTVLRITLLLVFGGLLSYLSRTFQDSPAKDPTDPRVLSVMGTLLVGISAFWWMEKKFGGKKGS